MLLYFELLCSREVRCFCHPGRESSLVEIDSFAFDFTTSKESVIPLNKLTYKDLLTYKKAKVVIGYLGGDKFAARGSYFIMQSSCTKSARKL